MKPREEVKDTKESKKDGRKSEDGYQKVSIIDIISSHVVIYGTIQKIIIFHPL